MSLHLNPHAKAQRTRKENPVGRFDIRTVAMPMTSQRRLLWLRPARAQRVARPRTYALVTLTFDLIRTLRPCGLAERGDSIPSR